MEIDLKKVDEGINIVEYVIRGQEKKEDGEPLCNYTFQANVLINNIDSEDYLKASFSYYDNKGEFLGLSTDSLLAEYFMERTPYPISFDLNVPENTQLVKCQINIDQHKLSIGGFFTKGFALLIFIFIASHIVKIWM